MVKKILLGVLAIGICLFAYNQYEQHRAIQEQKRIEAQIKANNDKIIENLKNRETIAQPRRGIY